MQSNKIAIKRVRCVEVGAFGPPCKARSTNNHIPAPLNALSGSSAVPYYVAEAVGRFSVDEDGLAAGLRVPGVTATAGGVNAWVIDPDGGASVDVYVGGTGHSRTACSVRTSDAAVGVGWDEGFVSEAGLRWHSGFPLRPVVNVDVV